MSTSARILVVDDDPAIRKIIRDRFKAQGHNVADAANGREALQRVEEFSPAVMILDLRMPILDGFGVLEALAKRPVRPDVVVITAHGSVDAAVQATQMGAADFIQKPFEPAHLEHVVAKTLDARRLRKRVASLEHELSAKHTLVMGQSTTMREVVEVAKRAAPSNATVLLLGESGTGKEVLARFLHANSKRCDGPFVALNCATLSEELLTSELFGHEKGAFTGAVATKQGKVEQAAGGTLFLDEIGELSANLQAKLLRVLQEKEFERVGGERTIQADVRVIAATHQDLVARLQDGRFREDLYYRINVVSLRVPPLRERPSDLPELVEHFLRKHGQDSGRTEMSFSEDAMAQLAAHDWPGNVRELSNVVERAVVLAPEDVIGLADLPAGLGGSADPNNCGDLVSLGFHEAVNESKRRIIGEALVRCGGHQTRAAELLGLTQPYLSRLMKNLGLRGQGLS
jgi:DNA-binding NtrC family response regulator